MGKIIFEDKDDVSRNAAFVSECTVHKPVWAMILGSAFSQVARRLERKVVFPYEMLFGMASTTVKGHEGKLVVGLLGGTTVAVFSGRPHVYETASIEKTLMPVCLAGRLGAKYLVITNAAGGMRRTMLSGDLMIVSDHIDMMPTAVRDSSSKAENGTAKNKKPLRAVYDGELCARFAAECSVRKIRCTLGTYVGLSGPCYETGAETVLLRRIGADAVGMSTVHETLEAERLGLRTLAVSCISNVIGACNNGPGPAHNSVLENTARAALLFADVITEIVSLDC